MAGGNVIGSQKEMTAVINNLKESRVLDKAIDTLSLEESYSVKLLDLNTKMVNLQYNHLQSNVSKIKTHLTLKDIAAMKTLELEGKLKCESLIAASTSKSKIAAATKRLKFSNTNKRAVTAMSRLGKHHIATNEEKTPKLCTVRRHSVTEEPLERSSILCTKLRPQTSTGSRNSEANFEEVVSGKQQRPNTAQILERIATAQKARKNLSRQTTYSCHDGKGHHGSGIANDVFGPSPYEVRRIKYLEQEYNKIKQLGIRQCQFLGKTTEFVKENPCIYELRPEATEEIIHSIDSIAMRPGTDKNKIRGVSCKALIDSMDPALLKQFNENRKTLYLRIDESLVDYSGVNTLAKAQLGRMETWRNLGCKNRVSFKTAVAL